MSFDFKGLLKNAVENAIASAIVLSTGIQDAVKLPNNEISMSLKSGAVMTASEQLIEMYNNGSSKFDRMDWQGIADDVVFNGSAFWLLNKTNVSSNIMKSIGNISPLDKRYNEMIISGALMTGIASTRDLIDSSPQLSQTPLKFLTHPIKSLM